MHSNLLNLHHIDKNHFGIGGQNSGQMRGRTSLIKRIYVTLEESSLDVLELPHQNKCLGMAGIQIRIELVLDPREEGNASSVLPRSFQLGLHRVTIHVLD